MPARTRRVRILLAAVCLVTVYFLYNRNAAAVEQYADYITDGAVGGGAVLRKPETYETQSSEHAPAYAETTSEPGRRASPTTTAVLLHETTSTAAARIEDTSTSSPAPAQVTEHAPWDVGGSPMGDASPTPEVDHWSKHPERYPVSPTAQLPSGSPKAIPLIQKAEIGGADKEKLAVIKEAAQHAWSGYRRIAWGYDEVKPVSGEPKNTFNGWGATLVDSMDTLWIMGMKEEFEEGVQKIQEIDFTTSPRDDIPLFEVTIRYLGGLIAAFDISDRKYSALLDKAVELAEILYSAFDTPNRMPETYYHWKPAFAANSHRAGTHVVMAELGTLSLEFTRLSQLTGEPKYYDAIARITDEFAQWQNHTRIPGMWPNHVDASGCQKPAQMAMSWNKDVQVPVPVHAGESTVTSSENPSSDQHYVDRLPGSDNIAAAKPPNEASRPSYPSSNKEKRQLESPDSSSPGTVPEVNYGGAQLHPQAHVPAKDELLTGAEVCIPQGLGSSSLNAPETFTLGGASDSTYEYLPKEYLLLGGRLEVYKDMFLGSMKAVVEKILFRPMTEDELDILISGEVKTTVNFTTGEIHSFLNPKQEHLTCFTGGMFAMGGKIFNKPEYVEVGRKLTEGCIWSYNSTASGIMPEVFTSVPCESTRVCHWNQTKYWEYLDPYQEMRQSVDLALSEYQQWDLGQAGQAVKLAPVARPDPHASANLNKRQTQESGSTFADLDRAQAQPPVSPPSSNASPYKSPLEGLNEPGAGYSEPVYTPPAPVSHEDFVRQRIRDQRLPPGFVMVEGRNYILRPEAIESVFYMYRITGEPYWREAGWKMFQAIDRATRTEYGHSMITDITLAEPWKGDGMESFWLAETLKYFYLLFDEPDRWSLDDWVLNTEAHFFRRPENPFRRSSTSGPGGPSAGDSGLRG